MHASCSKRPRGQKERGNNESCDLNYAEGVIDTYCVDALTSILSMSTYLLTGMHDYFLSHGKPSYLSY